MDLLIGVLQAVILFVAAAVAPLPATAQNSSEQPSLNSARIFGRVLNLHRATNARTFGGNLIRAGGAASPLEPRAHAAASAHVGQFDRTN